MKIRSITFTKILLVLVCVALSSTAQAVLPAPDGGYPGGNTAEGQNALFSLTTGGFNTANGFLALRSNTIGQFNTATGAGALLLNTANENTATGAGALLSNTTGRHNTANGAFALFSNTEGTSNTATGDQALFSNTTGSGNTAIGTSALQDNTTAGGNTAIGTSALNSNTEGEANTATGAGALVNNTTGRYNTAIGNGALLNNTTGGYNTAIGRFALGSSTGTGNTALGLDAGSSLTTGNNNVDINNSGAPGEFETIRIGASQTRTFIAGISGVPVTGTGVVVSLGGQLGVAPSSRRFKDELKPMDKASEAIFALKPVTFRYKHEIDPIRIPQFGLVAEQVEKVNRDLVVCDGNGEIYTVRYDAINAMLLNEFLKEHRKVQQQEATIADVRSAIAQQQKEIQALATTVKEQAAQIQKVTAQIELNKPPPRQVVLKSPSGEYR